MRQRTLKVFEAQLQTFNEERESRAWSAIYEVKGTPGDGGRRAALQYLHGRKGNLAGLPLAKAYLGGVELPGVNLSEAKSMIQNQIDDAFYCELSGPPELPAELSPPLARECDAEGKPIKE